MLEVAGVGNKCCIYMCPDFPALICEKLNAVVCKMHLIDKFTIIVKLCLVCQTHSFKRHFQTDAHSNGQWRKSFWRNGDK